MDDASLEVLLHATSSTEALHSLYTLQKAKDAKRSMAYLCRRAKISSTGYLSDVLSGRRMLHPRYRDGMVAALGLKDAAADCLKLLIDLDTDKDQRQVALKRRLKLMRKVLQTAYRSSGELQGLFSALEVFCAFGLFGNKPSKQELLSYFGSGRSGEVEASLASLLQLGLIKESAKGCYTLLANQVFFGADGIHLSHIDFLKLAMTHAAANFEAWFGDPRLASFTSSFISVNSVAYAKKLAQLNRRLKIAQSDLESGDADMLIRFNLQIYPVGLPAPK